MWYYKYQKGWENYSRAVYIHAHFNSVVAKGAWYTGVYIGGGFENHKLVPVLLRSSISVLQMSVAEQESHLSTYKQPLILNIVW
jgi:hypothetical protein